ncbi:hypothetical protein [Streptomyces sp. H27-D2]|uniref:hypothetical protein n=1 Tax=Streptomyces sp. H27-D2 TaxID=3046304 RepID=UPI002DB68FFF|nr:hypothetical protein [Streptomyces sp. H27-D2]MEC4016772.1 hypothetical protein [Streptomyces sp. H27-D2]
MTAETNLYALAQSSAPAAASSEPAELRARLRWYLRGSTPGDRKLTAVGYAGPAAGDLLYWLYRLESIAEDVRSVLADIRSGPTPCGLGCDFANRVTHALLPCGSGVDHALRLLRREFNRISLPKRPDAGPQPGQGPPVELVVWAHIVCSVRAEAAICAERAALVGGLGVSRRGAARERAMRQGAPRQAPSSPQWRECECAPPEGFAEAVVQSARHAELLFRDMARLPGFRAWRSMADPLYRGWLDGALYRTAAPPPLFRNCEELYRDYPSLASGWEPGSDTASQIADALPLGSLERYAQDQDGLEWAVIVAVPDEGADPRNWQEPTAAVVAAHLPPRSSQAFCYVLADGLVPRDVMRHLYGFRGLGSLEGIAAALGVLSAP